MKPWLVCAGPDWHRPSVTSTKQLARQFHGHGYRVLWVNPIAFKSPFVNSATRASAWRKIRNKLRTHLRWLSRPLPGFWVWVPVYMPGFGQRSDRINRALLRFQFGVLRVLLGLHPRAAVLWMSGGFTALHFGGIPFLRTVYQAADMVSDFRDASPELRARLQEKERALCAMAQVRFAASEQIAEKLERLCGQTVEVLHHGVDYDRCVAPAPLDPRMERIRSLGKPCAGYYGSLSDANDKDVLWALAENGFSVVLGGAVLGDYERLKSHPDIHFLGPIPYERLPSVAQGFDVALLNWRAHDWIANCFPVKALEYLAFGLPVVSCPIPVLQVHFAEVIRFAETTDEFVRLCREAVGSDNEHARSRRRESVHEWTWARRYATEKERLQLS